MKKLAILATAFVLAASAANAESVTINHVTAGGLKAELDAAIAASETLTSYADITELTITGEAYMQQSDLNDIRDNMTTTLVMLDMSGAAFENNNIPGPNWQERGSLSGMKALKTVRIPETIRSINGGCFSNCSALESVNLPDGMTAIQDYMFRNCSKLNLEKLPSSLTLIRQYAFSSCKALTVSELPAGLKEIGTQAFRETKVSFAKLPENITFSQGAEAVFQNSEVAFSEIPVSLKSIPANCFAATKVTFNTIPDHITSIGTAVFRSVKTLPEFTIPNVAGLWSKIPNALFWVDPRTDFARTFICRAPEAPEALVNTKNDSWDGVFGRGDKFPEITFKVLASALESYRNTAPYNTMTLEVLKTAVPEPVIEMPVGHDAANINVKFVVNNVEHSSFGEVLEGEGKFVVSFGDAAHEWLHIQEISYVAPETYAEGEEEVGDATEETDPNVLYRVGNVSENLKKSIEVPVTVSPDMKPLHVVVAMADVVTGVEQVNAPDAVVTRNGDIINLTVPGATLYDLAGRLVLSTDTNTLDLGSVPAGVYVLRAGKKAVKIVK